MSNANEDLYTLYLHSCISNGKVYIGITNKDTVERWGVDGKNYQSNFELYSDIKKFGWKEGFLHKIIKDNLTLEQVKEEEKHLIVLFDSMNPEKGYNRKPGGGYGRCSTQIGLGSKIKILRKGKGYTQEQLADLLRLTRATISNYEVERRRPHISELKHIADFFGVSLNYFGAELADASFEINSRIVDYFKADDISVEDKISLFNDVVIAYTKYILETN